MPLATPAPASAATWPRPSRSLPRRRRSQGRSRTGLSQPSVASWCPSRQTRSTRVHGSVPLRQERDRRSDLDDDREHQRAAPQPLVDEGRDVVVEVLLDHLWLALFGVLRSLRERPGYDIAKLRDEAVVAV